MSISTTVKNQLIKQIEGLDSVQKVFGYQELDPKGFPAVFVTAGSMDGEFVDNAHNSRVYSFNVLCVMPTGQDFIRDEDVNREQKAEEIIATVLDEIINAVDTNFELEGQPVLYANAADIIWGSANLEIGVAKAAQITLRIYTEYQVGQ